MDSKKKRFLTVEQRELYKMYWIYMVLNFGFKLALFSYMFAGGIAIRYSIYVFVLVTFLFVVVAMLTEYVSRKSIEFSVKVAFLEN